MATPCQASAVVMSMVLTHEQRAFQIAARDFARDVIIPQVQAIGPSCPVVNPCAAVTVARLIVRHPRRPPSWIGA